MLRLLIALAPLIVAETAVDLVPATFNASVFGSNRACAMVWFYSREGAAADLTRSLEPVWNEVAQNFEGNGAVLIATVDCNFWTGGMMLCNRFVGKPNKFPFPTVMHFSPPHPEPQIYEGEKTAKAMTTFANELASQCSLHAIDDCIDKKQKAELQKYAGMSVGELQKVRWGWR